MHLKMKDLLHKEIILKCVSLGDNPCKKNEHMTEQLLAPQNGVLFLHM